MLHTFAAIMDYYHFFAYAGTAFEFIPVIAGIIVFKNAKTKYRLFLFYLLLGFLIDLPKAFITSDHLLRWMNNIYSLIETPLLLWFIGQCISNKTIKAYVFPAMLLTVIFWFYCHFIHESSVLNYSMLLDVTTSVLISAAAAYALLLMTQEETNITALPDFWFMAGLFFYFFIAGFLFSFLESELLKKIWFIHNILSMLAFLVFVKAFLTVNKKESVISNQ